MPDPVSPNPPEYLDDTRIVTRRYRRAPGGWWWGALLGVPLALTALGGVGGGQASPTAASTTPAVTATTPTPTAPTTAPTTASDSAAPTDAATSGPTPTDPAATTAATATGGATATPTDDLTETVTATVTSTASRVAPTASATTPDATETVTVTATPTPSASGTLQAGAIRCASFTRDVAGILARHPITFDSGGTRLTASSRQTVGAVASALTRCDTAAAVVTGYTDDTGSPEQNKQVSAQRAAAVRQQLIADGVPASRVASAGAGQDRPVASNATAEGRAKNRRVEIVAN